MRIKIINKPANLANINLADIKDDVESIYTLYKNADNIPLGIGYDGSVHKFVAEMKGMGIDITGIQGRSIIAIANKYFSNKYPEKIPFTQEHRQAYPEYYEEEEE